MMPNASSGKYKSKKFFLAHFQNVFLLILSFLHIFPFSHTHTHLSNVVYIITKGLSDKAGRLADAAIYFNIITEREKK